ncbi:MAG TPA: AbrB/MazE/SpoVT family DNA-binding domain-containing protein [Thermoanaerobaculia bacterium]|nr:AbrB/MazE/SpoVT family DNA-binding domain-containing protein [Thermoanaerobaculia bacterium]
MSTARVTSKGQITIPASVRRALGIDQGDDLQFEVTSERSAELRVVKRRRLSELYGSLAATRPFPGKDEVREEAGRELGKALASKRP